MKKIILFVCVLMSVFSVNVIATDTISAFVTLTNDTYTATLATTQNTFTNIITGQDNAPSVNISNRFTFATIGATGLASKFGLIINFASYAGTGTAAINTGETVSTVIHGLGVLDVTNNITWDTNGAVFAPTYLIGDSYSYFRIEDIKFWADIATDNADIIGTITTGATGRTTADVTAEPYTSLTSDYAISTANGSTTYPNNITLTVNYPGLISFNGYSGKYGIELFGLRCPENIIVHFKTYANTVTAPTRGGGTAASTITIARNDLFLGVVYSYPTTSTFIARSTTTNNYYGYYYEYQNWQDDGTDRYSPVVAVDTAEEVDISDTAFAVYYSFAQNWFGPFE
jgi:hypothetical protein